MYINVKLKYKNGNLKSLRTLAGLSQSQLADSTGLNVRTVQHYEQGSKDLNAAKLSTILKLCKVLRCSLEDILDDRETLDLLDEYKTCCLKNAKTTK